MAVTKDQIHEKLTEVMDPELNMSITDLGLIYNIDLKPENKVKITMTLTTIGCPLFATIEEDIKNKLSPLGFKDSDIELELTFDPPWSMEKMSERAKALLGI